MNIQTGGPTPQFATVQIRFGWICPRCGKTNNPDANQCWTLGCMSVMPPSPTAAQFVMGGTESRQPVTEMERR